MTKRIFINPVTRISGFLELEVFLEGNKVVDAKTKGEFFRGFETILVGRNPFDVVYFTQRICGICSAAHSMASSLALEDALQVPPSEQGKYLRDIIHCAEFLQNHIRHFYQYGVPDYVKLPDNYGFTEVEHMDYRLPEKENATIVEHYLQSLQYSRKAHQLLSVLGGKAPHNHGVYIGGTTTQATVDKIVEMKSMLQSIKQFINDVMVPDVYTIANYYKDYFHIGGGNQNLLSYGCFDSYDQLPTLYVDPLVYTNGVKSPFESNKIEEQIDFSYYIGNETYNPKQHITLDPDMNKKGAYSWVKAPRYDSLPFEVGPLARLSLSGDYTNGISTMDRTIARVLEAKKIAEIATILLDELIPNVDTQQRYELPEEAEGQGLVDTTRGALGHWLKIKNKKVAQYQIITPSTWDFSTRDKNGHLGTAEQALIGVTVQDPKHPIELSRILRSFDPCMSCATHVYTSGSEKPQSFKVFG